MSEDYTLTMAPERMQVAIDRQKVEEILKQFTLPSEFERVDVHYGPDHDGDASVSLSFVVKNDVQIADEEIPRLSRFMSTVVSALYNGDVGGYVYSRLDEAA